MNEIVTLTQAGSVVFASWAIISGIGAWKREFIGKRKIELAEQVLAKFFEIRDAIAYIRNPFSNGSEGKSRSRGSNESEAESNLLDRGYIVVERYGEKEAIFREFNTLKYRFMASFGKDTEEIFARTNQALNSIFSSASILANYYWKRQGVVPMEEAEFQRHLEEMRHHESIFWDTSRENDPIREELKTTLRKLEEVTLPCFSEPISTYTFLTQSFSKRKTTLNTTS